MIDAYEVAAQDVRACRNIRELVAAVEGHVHNLRQTVELKVHVIDVGQVTRGRIADGRRRAGHRRARRLVG